MNMKQADYFTYQNKIKALKHEMELIVAQMDGISTSIKNVLRSWKSWTIISR
jgi:hypothetical protein